MERLVVVRDRRNERVPRPGQHRPAVADAGDHGLSLDRVRLGGRNPRSQPRRDDGTVVRGRLEARGLKLCVTTTGNDQTLGSMRAWKYKPLLANGRAVPVCTAVTFIYSPYVERETGPIETAAWVAS